MIPLPRRGPVNLGRGLTALWMLAWLGLVSGLAPVCLAAAVGGSARCEFVGLSRLSSAEGSPVLTWSTARELGVIGFDLLQGEGSTGKFTAVNSALIAASNCPAGAAYTLPVSAEVAASTKEFIVRVWAEDATFTDHACRIAPARTATALPGSTGSLTRLLASDGSVEDLSGRIGKSAFPAGAILAEPSRPRVRPAKSDLPVVVSVDVHTSRAGVHFLGFAELAAAFQMPVEEVARRADQGLLTLRQQGVRVPSWGDTAAGGRHFFAPRTESLFFAGHVTQVSFAAAPPMETRVVPADLAPGRTYGHSRATEEKNLQGVPTLPGAAEDDFWVWDSFLGGHPTFGTRAYPFDLTGLAESAEAAVVEVELISASEAEHQFNVVLNGHELGREAWSGRQRRRLRFAADPAWLLAAGNSLQLISTGDRLSLSYLDRFTVGYARTLRPVEGPLRFSATEDAVLEAAGPAGAVVEVWDVTTPTQPVRLEIAGPTSARETLRFQALPGRDYVTFLQGVAISPDRFQPFGPETLRAIQAGAEYLAIAPEPLTGATSALADRRRAQGLSSLVVSLADIQHEFAFGIPTPTALAAFLGHARSNWTILPRYAVLVGDGTYDYQDHLARGDNLLPPLLTATSFGRAVSDVLFGDVDHDGRPEIALGRLPVHTEAELLRLLGQMDDFGARTVTLPQALLLADRPDEGGEFITNAEELGSRLAGSFTVGTILNDALETPAVRELLAQKLSAGVNLFNYIGHGGRDRLGSGYLTAAEAGTVDFGPQQPFVVAMTCAAGQFGLPGSPCLGEALLLKPGRAPIAVWSPSGFSIDFQAHLLNLLLAEELARQPVGTRLGDTLRRVVTAFRDQDGDRVTPALYNLLGDPALPLNFGARPVALSARLNGDALRLGLAGSPVTTYRVESAVRLDGTDWQLLREVVTDASGKGEVAQPLSGGPASRYFRAVPGR